MLPLSKSDRLALVSLFGTACLGFLAWAFPNMSRFVTIPGAIITFGFAVYFSWPELNAFYKGRPYMLITIVIALLLAFGMIWDFWPRSNQADIEMAERWVNLSNEITGDLPTLGTQFRMTLPSGNEDWHKQWQDEVNRVTRETQEALDRMSRVILMAGQRG
jgi:hypothetical protein